LEGTPKKEETAALVSTQDIQNVVIEHNKMAGFTTLDDQFFVTKNDAL
jgi:hypothetical protein